MKGFFLYEMKERSLFRKFVFRRIISNLPIVPIFFLFILYSSIPLSSPFKLRASSVFSIGKSDDLYSDIGRKKLLSQLINMNANDGRKRI